MNKKILQAVGASVFRGFPVYLSRISGMCKSNFFFEKVSHVLYVVYEKVEIKKITSNKEKEVW